MSWRVGQGDCRERMGVLTGVCPARDWVLEPFCGSGSMGRAAVIEGLHYIGHVLCPMPKA